MRNQTLGIRQTGVKLASGCVIMVTLPLGLSFPIWKVGIIEVSDILRNKGVKLKR